jgi:hypothetical protein
MAKKSLMRRAEAAVPRKGGYDRRKANRISLWIVIVVAIVFAAYMAVQLSTDPASVSDRALSVRALFGFRVALSDIRELRLETTPVALEKRIFGNNAFGLFSEGEFEVDGLGTARVFLKKPNVSYITIRTDNKNYAISLGSLDKDQLLYDAIKAGEK